MNKEDEREQRPYQTLAELTRDDIWQKAIEAATGGKKKVSISPKALVKHAERVAEVYVQEWISERAGRLIDRMGGDALLDLDKALEDRLHKLDPLWWYSYRETYARADEDSTIDHIAYTLAFLCWRRLVTRDKCNHLFGFTEQEAEQMIAPVKKPIVQLALFSEVLKPKNKEDVCQPRNHF